MTNEIATQLKSIIDRNTELVDLNQSDNYWQTKVCQAVNGIDSSKSTYLIFPSTVEILATVVKLAADRGWRILICGNGSKLQWGNFTQNIQLIISTQKCDCLIEHAVGDLTVTAEAGMKLVDLQNILRSHNQFLPIDPSYPNNATLGGIVACGDTGSWRERYGSIRDILLGISFVRADGAIAKAGGRVVKNVAGYDLMKLFTGAYGTLGIISQLTFRTFPLISTSQTLLLTGEASNIALAVKTVRNSGLTPTAMDLLSRKVIEQLQLNANIGLMIRWQSIPESIERQIEQVKAISTELNLTTKNYQGQAEVNLWQQCANLFIEDTAVICKIGIVPTMAVKFLQSPEVVNNNVAARIHAGSGIGKLQSNDLDCQAISKMRSLIEEKYGFLTILNAPNALKQQVDIWGYRGNAISAMQAIKNQFDPQNILNPNRFIV